MASSDAVDQDHSLRPVSSDDSKQFFLKHGFFYKNNPEIGKVVDDLYKNRNAQEANLDHFKTIITKDAQLEKLLHEYPIEIPMFSRPWGVTKVPYKWNKNSSAEKTKEGIIAYFLGSEPGYSCWDSSHKLQYEGDVDIYGTRPVPEEILGSYRKLDLDPHMKDGGILFVDRLCVHKAKGYGIMVGLVKPATPVPPVKTQV